MTALRRVGLAHSPLPAGGSGAELARVTLTPVLSVVIAGLAPLSVWSGWSRPPEMCGAARRGVVPAAGRRGRGTRRPGRVGGPRRLVGPGPPTRTGTGG